jgi:glyoxylase-like metal-dependent hydrolase (beta-lactamase superfamily II)
MTMAMFGFAIGDIAITQIEEFVDPGVPVQFLLPDLPDDVIPANLDWLAPRFLDPATMGVDITMQSWLIRTRHHTILVDTCGGNHKPREHFPVFHQRRSSAWLDNLRAAGVSPEDIDYVFCTHLHIDHVGWNTRLENGVWVPTFPNARYLWSQAEYDHARPAGDGADDGEHAIFVDSVLPVVEAGLAQMVGPSFDLDDQIAIETAPGHTPGHSLLRAKSGGQVGLFTGDALHHPLQIAAPDCNSFACADAHQARATRRRILGECADHGHLLVPAHFAAPHVGRITRAGDAFRFRPGP